MKKYLVSLLGLLLVAGIGNAALTANQIWQLDHQMGPVAYSIQLGTLLSNVEAVANSVLAEGSLWVGDNTGSAAAVDFSGDAKIPIGDGTTLNSVAVSGDVTIDNAGAVTIAANAIETGMIKDGEIVNADIGAAAGITEGKLAIASGKILIGSVGNVGAAQTLTGDVTVSVGGVTAIGAGKVTSAMLEAPTGEGLSAMRVAKAVFDVATDTGTIGAHGLGVSLPANAMLLRSWFYTVTQFVDAGAGTVALHCEDAGNIFVAADITGNAIGTKIQGVQDGLIANYTGSIGAPCELTATVAGADQTAGKLILFVEYVIVE